MPFALPKPFSQACENNKDSILSVLQRVFADRKNVLEIGSGTGQHAAYFAQKLSHLSWQTSDLSANHLGINAWIDSAQLANLQRPILISADDPSWPITNIEAIFSANTCHIMAWESVRNLFKNIEKVITKDSKIAIYGPFKYDGNFTSESNEKFDFWLKQQAPHQGIRDIEAVCELAKNIGLTLVEDNQMPANNQLLIWQKI